VLLADIMATSAAEMTDEELLGAFADAEWFTGFYAFSEDGPMHAMCLGKAAILKYELKKRLIERGKCLNGARYL